MIIGVSGHGASGASAVVDLIKEFNEVSTPNIEAEFPIVYAPDGILDLEYHLLLNPTRYYGCDIAIFRFLKYVKQESKKNIHFASATNNEFEKISKEYINDITQLKWKGYWYFDWYFHNIIFNKIFFSLGRRIDFKLFKNKPYGISKYRYMHLSVKPTNFYEASSNYIRKILCTMGLPNNGKILLDQPFPYNNPEACFKFFDDPIAIIVNRDPRDIYVLIKEYFNESWIACDTVEDFIKYYKIIRDVSYKDNDRILTIQYEDLIFNYERTRDKIKTILRLHGEEESRKGQLFNPDVSVGNVQLYLKHEKYKDDIKKIENSLREYLFDFASYKYDGDMTKAKTFIYTSSQKKR